MVSLEEVRAEIDLLAVEDESKLIRFLETHEAFLEENGELKLLALSYYRAGSLKKSVELLDRLSPADIDADESKLGDAIRRQLKNERRLAMGIFVPSNKPFAKRVLDGARNILRHGRLRDPSSRSAKGPRSLRAISNRIRASRMSDVRELRSLLDRFEEKYRLGGHEKFLAFNYYHAGCLSKAAAYARLSAIDEAAPEERTVLQNILFEADALERLRNNQDPIELNGREKQYERAAGPLRSLYLAASSLPFNVSGYTARSRSIIEAMLGNASFTIVPATRPGYPFDRSDARSLSSVGDKNLLFQVLENHGGYRGDLNAYLQSCLPSLLQLVERERIGLIHGVSNYRNGAVGLALARSAELPFIYEIRGLWEETTDSKLAGWRETERFEFERRFEQYLYRSADGVLVINEQVRSVLEQVPRKNVRILPNCVRAEQIVQRAEKPETGELRIGYVGSIVEYEGLDDLVRAIALLQGKRADVRLDVFGRGPDLGPLKELTKHLGVKHARFHGAVEPAIVPTLYKSFDVCVFPRKPYRVCQLVTPLKPLEAMANDVNVIVSDVAPMKMFASDGSALSCKAGDVKSLVETIEWFIAMTFGQRADMREQARTMLRNSYIWEMQDVAISKVYDAALVSSATVNTDQQS